MSKIKWKKQTKYHTVETTSNIKIVKRGQLDTDNTQIMTAHFPCFGTGTSIKSDEAKLALLAQTSPLSEMTWTNKVSYIYIHLEIKY